MAKLDKKQSEAAGVMQLTEANILKVEQDPSILDWKMPELNAGGLNKKDSMDDKRKRNLTANMVADMLFEPDPDGLNRPVTMDDKLKKKLSSNMVRDMLYK